MELSSKKREGRFKGAKGSSQESLKLSIFHLFVYFSTDCSFLPEKVFKVSLEQHIYCSLLAHTCLPIQLFSISACRNIFLDIVKLLLNISAYGLWMQRVDIPAEFPFCQGINTTSSLLLWLCPWLQMQISCSKTMHMCWNSTVGN